MERVNALFIDTRVKEYYNSLIMPNGEAKGAVPSTPDGRPIQPDDIDTGVHFFDAFNHSETEVSARYIVGLCQTKGSWEPFTQQEIEAFYRSYGHEDGFTFNALIEPVTELLFDGRTHTVGGGWIIQEGEKFIITPEFINRVFKSSPVKRQ